jgi:hypothetical protein
VNAWPFIIASYVVGIGGTAALAAWSWAAMRRAEGDAAQLGRGE